MQHSIAAKYAARPAAHFVRPSSRARERRLGLRSAGTFQPASPRQTVLRHSNLSPLVRLRAGWRAVRPARSKRSVVGRLQPVVVMRWAGCGTGSAQRQTGAASAPWRA
ncbi:MAG TPA: hypothetical protein VNF73_00865 [Candidatus Saccharimonadales bacterium]|nr:hypothetical protein [Candidatus Saccharimonadales bacterium]